MGKVYSFSAGPAMLPSDVLVKAQSELLDWQHTGMSVMEFSHQSNEFATIREETEARLRALMSIPDDYHVLFSHGGGSGQFSAVPLNLIDQRESASKQRADFLVYGHWASGAYEEAKKFCLPRKLDVTCIREGKHSISPEQDWHIDPSAQFVFVCPNETVNGMEYHALPETNVPIVADMSSSILSRPIDVSRYGLIYAGTQKNIGPSGQAITIIRKDLIRADRHNIPKILDYRRQVEQLSMANTPPTFAWYLCGEVLKWVEQQGGVSALFAQNQAKASALYRCIDESDLYINDIHPDYRSIMNVTFRITCPKTEQRFLDRAHQAGLKGLKGHKVTGGIRASIYNAMPYEGVEALIDFMEAFEIEHKQRVRSAVSSVNSPTA